ncbi:argininosuccinate lyase [Streptomyces anulatus]|uniref:argininosuccinate lyase n=1 Tax=Streptomyces anulatus TaxID=1892 RepID=UPI0036A614D2
MTDRELSGRIDPTPSALLHEEVLRPQFQYEVRALLPGYVAVEKALLAEYLRLGVLDGTQARAHGAALHSIDAQTLVADPDENLSDIAFAIERHVTRLVKSPAPSWHVDRSRNDLQATAQLIAAKNRITDAVVELLRFTQSVRTVAGRTAELPMPGFTHHQAAQVITPGFYLAALGEQVLHHTRRLTTTHDLLDACPLGSGAMAGQELPWDRERLARLLGFARPQPSALVAVASRSWALETTAELSLLGTSLSRFATDLLTWGGSGYEFIDLPADLSGISSAMPQKKNFPVLERIRGRTAHLAGYHIDMLLGQRNTPFSNLVEVSKEAGHHLVDAFSVLHSVLRLFRAVVDRLEFRADRMRAACDTDYLGGFALANALTLTADVPWRTAQVLAGRYVLGARERGLPPTTPDPDLLVSVLADAGFAVNDPAGLLTDSFDSDRALRRMTSSGSTQPDAVAAALAAQDVERERLAAWARARSEAVRQAFAETDRLLSLPEPAEESPRAI